MAVIDPKTGLTFEQAKAQRVNWTAPKGAYDVPTTPTQPLGLKDVAGGTTITPPDVTAKTDTGGIFTAGQTISADSKFLQERLTQMETEAAKVKEEKVGMAQKITDYFAGRKPVAEEREELMAKYKVPEQYEKILALTPEINNLNQQIIDLDARYNRGLLQIESQPVAMGLILGRQAILNKQYSADKAGLAAQLGAKAALAEMYRGNITLAQSLINDTVEAITFDQRQKLEEYNWMFTYYADEYNTLSKDIKSNIDTQYDLLSKELENKKKTETDKMNLILDAAGKGVDLSAFTGKTLEETQKAYTQQVSAAAVAVTPTGVTPPTSYREWELAGGLTGTGKTYAQWVTQVKVPTITPGQQISYDKALVGQVSSEKGAFYDALKRFTKIDELASLAIASGASFEGFKQALLADKKVFIDSENIVRKKTLFGLREGKEKLGDLDDVRALFEGAVAPTQEELNNILFGEMEEF